MWTLGGNRTLTAINNANDGKEGWIQFTQDGTGGRTITLPANSYTASGQNGVLNISTAPNAISLAHWQKVGQTTLKWSLVDDLTTISAPACSNTYVDNGTATSTFTTQGASTTNTDKFVASAAITAPSAQSACKVEMVLGKIGAPTYNIWAELWTDDNATPGKPLAFIQQSNMLAASTLSATSGTITFTNLISPIANAQKFHVILRSDFTGTPNGTDYVKWYGVTTAATSVWRSTNGTVWNQAISNVQLSFKLYRQ
jgi:hypothetical protein